MFQRDGHPGKQFVNVYARDTRNITISWWTVVSSALRTIKGMVRIWSIFSILRSSLVLIERALGMSNPLPLFVELTSLSVSYLGVALLEAAADTTGVYLQMLFLCLLEHPDVLAKAQREIDEVIGFNRTPELGDIEKLPYIQAVMNEVRLCFGGYHLSL